jgi:hypothetical protein
MYPDPLPGSFQRPQALMAAPGYYTTPGYMLGQQQQAPYQPPAPANWSPWTGSGWDQQSLAISFNTLVLTPPPTATQDWVADSGASHHSTPSAGNISHIRTLTSSSPSSIIRVVLMSCVMLVSWLNTPGCLSPVPRIGQKNLLI